MRQAFFQSVMDFNSFRISLNLCSRLALSSIALKFGLGVCKYARFSLWISAISCLSASTRSWMPPSMQRNYTQLKPFQAATAI